MIEVIPGILEQGWSEIERKVALVAPHVAWVQIDIADNTMVPMATFSDFSQFKSLTNSTSRFNLSKLSLEAHLMVANPGKYIQPLVDSGFTRLIAHLEADDPRRFLDEVRYESVEVGVAIDGPTEFAEVEPFLEEVDLVLVMTAEVGLAGSPFLPEAVEKIKAIRRHLPDLPIEVEGGIDEVTAKIVKDAGATRLVLNTYIFKGSQKISVALENLKKA